MKWIAVVLLVLISIGCSSTIDDNRPMVLVTTNILADAVRTIAGDDLRVEALMGAGTDPHLYKARFSDIRRLEDADLILYNGLHLEGKLSEILDKMPGRAFPAADVLPAELLLLSDDGGNVMDPHIWFDVSIWSKVVLGLGETLAEFDKPNADSYRNRASKLSAELDSLHNEVVRAVATIPADSRILITAHDAFGYFGRAYGIEVRGLQGISTVSEYGVRDVSSLVTFVVENRIPAVFVESGIPPRSVESVIAGARQRGHTVMEGGLLYSDSLGGEDEPGATYVGMVRHNMNTIVRALGGTL
jgi:manganese/zinc/iron transport system substrate-binding protein